MAVKMDGSDDGWWVMDGGWRPVGDGWRDDRVAVMTDGGGGERATGGQ